jgi:hypothetical protein
VVAIAYQPVPFRTPDHLSQEVITLVKAAKTRKSLPEFSNVYAARFATLLTDPSCTDDPLVAAYTLHQMPFARACLDAFLMVDSPTSSIVASTEVSDEVVAAYAALFFDAGVYPNRLVKISFAEQMPAGTAEEKRARDLMTWGIHLGWEYLAWKVSGGRITMPAAVAVHQLLSDSLWRSREHVFSSLTDARTKESRAWVPQVLKAAELMHKMDAIRDNPIETLRIHLLDEDETCSIYELPEGQELLS